MKPIIAPIDANLIEQELTPKRFLRKTNKLNNELYVVNAHNAPNTMLEIGRLREIAFRNGGGGTGEEIDVDKYDYLPEPYQQLIVWDPAEKKLLGGYRFLLGKDVEVIDGKPNLATAHLFDYSEKFMNEFMHRTIELGRSFVAEDYQSSKSGTRSIFTLDNLWDGLGALFLVHKDMEFLFGKVTMYSTYDHICRDMIVYFMQKHFPDEDNLISPKNRLVPIVDTKELDDLFVGLDFKEDYKILNGAVRERGTNIPPLVNTYIGTSPTTRMFGTTVDHSFSDVPESGILVRIDDIYDVKKARHLTAEYINYDISYSND
ncbi:MAG: GNAT family N-acetyltransferase [Bacteroidales bacterium]